MHCLVNNAGVPHFKPFLEVTPAEIDSIFDVNLKAVINVSQVVARGLVARGEGGVIINISSVGVLKPVKECSVYCASKAALDHLMRVMTLELGPHGIRVNCVNPTVVKTEMSEFIWSDPAVAEPFLKMTPLGRFAETDDVVNPATLFLLSDHASLISGVTMPVDGGFTAC